MLNGIPHQGRRRAAGERRVSQHAKRRSFCRSCFRRIQSRRRAPRINFSVYARLKPGVSFEQARAEMDRIGKDLEAQYPQLSRGHGAHVTSLPEEITGPVERTLVVLMAAVAFILLIACINVTNLLLAKAAGRRREMAVRAAIGAARARLMRQVLVECAVLALAGGAAGLFLAVWSVRLLAAQLPAVARPDQTVIFSVPVLAFTLVACLVTGPAGGCAAGVAPGARRSRGAAQGRRPKPGQPEARAALRPHRRRGRADVAAARRRRPHAAKLPDGAVAAGRHRDEQPPHVPDRPAGRALPGSARGVALLQRARIATGRRADDPVGRRHHAAAADRTRRTPRRRDRKSRGRSGRWPDARASARRSPATICRRSARDSRGTRLHCRPTPRRRRTVAIVNETMAKRYWPGASPIGKRVRFTDQDIWREVVGVIGDVKHWGLDAPVNPELYVPATQFSGVGVDLGAPRPTAIRSRSCRSRSATSARSTPTCRCSRCGRWRKSPRDRSSGAAGR